jgi:VanZ family protein
VFTGLFINDFEHLKNIEKYSTKWWIYPLVATFLMGFITEIVQHFFIEGRNGDPVDLIINLLGSVTVTVVYRKFRL